MDNSKTIACVTGASGMVGSRIVERLMRENYRVRVLSRKSSYPLQDVEHFRGGLEDESVLKEFVTGAQLMFHCAAELRDKSRMWAVNVKGTGRLVEVANDDHVEFFCFISSAGVVGPTEKKWVDETVSCYPQNFYEKSKWESEKIVLSQLTNCRVVALRPANIFDNELPGIMKEPKGRSARGSLLRWVNGSEAAHMIHAKDVAAAAVELINHQIETPDIFFVSCDEEPLNTIEGIFKLFEYVSRKRPLEKPYTFPSLPLWVPYLIRTLRRGRGNRGDVRYSSAKLNSTGFRFPVGFLAATKGYFRMQIGKPVDETQVLGVPGSKDPLNSVTVLGGSGFLGKHLIQNLDSRGQTQLNVLVHSNKVNDLDLLSHVSSIKGDILSRDSLLKVIEPGATVVNLVRLNFGSSRLNIKAAECLASVCVERCVRRLIHCSTATVVGDSAGNLITDNTTCRPKGSYNRINLEIERVLRTKADGRFEIVVLRPTAVFGKGGQNLIKMIEDLKDNHWWLKYLRSCLYNKRRMNLVGIDSVAEALNFLITTDEPVNQKVFIISDDEDPNNNYWYVEKELIRAMNLPKYPLPLIPLPLFMLELALFLSKRGISRTRRRYEWRSLKKAGYQKKMSFTKALQLFISELDKAQSSSLYVDRHEEQEF